MSKKSNTKNIKIAASFLLAVLLFSLSWIRFQSFQNPINNEDFNQKSIESLGEKKNILKTTKKTITVALSNDNSDTLFSIFNSFFYENLNRENLSIHVFKKDSIVFWSNNKVPIYLSLLTKNASKVQKIQNGWYYLDKYKIKDYTVVSCIKIQNEFAVHNDFLTNNYLLFDTKNQNVEIFATPKANLYMVKDSDNSFLFSFRLSPNSLSNYTDTAAILLLFLAILISLYFFQNISSLFFSNVLISSSAFIFFVISIRFVTLVYPTIFFWNLHSLFQPQSFAISAINSSLADYLINVILGYFVTNFLIENFKLDYISKFNQKIYLIFSLVIVVVLSFVFTKYVSVLVSDSSINYNFNNFVELENSTFIAIAIIGFLCNIYFLIISALTKQVISQISWKELILLTISLLFVWIILLFTQFNLEGSIFFFIAILLILLYTFNHSAFINTTYSKVVFIISVFAIWSSIIINNQLIQKKEQTSKLLAEKVSLEKDVVAENLFSEISIKIKSDSTLLSYLFKTEKQKQQFFKRLTEKYFNGYWDKFETRMYVYDAQCNQLAKSTNANDEKLTVFEEVCSKKELESSATNLFYVPTENDEDAGLVCKFVFTKIVNQIQVPLTVFLQFTIKYNADEIGFPSLLLDKKIGQSKEKFNEYSYAKYKYNLLVPISKNNTYNYPLKADFITKESVKKQMILSGNFFNYEDYRHYYYKPFKTSAYIVSFKYLTFFEKLTVSSYLFAIFIILFLLKYAITNSQNLMLPRFDTLNKKIRTVLISSVFAGLLILASVTTYFLISHFNKDKREKLTENIQSLFIELENKFGDEKELLQSNTEYYNYLLSKSSNVFFNDINLYNLQGSLIASSRFKIFDEGILSNKMNSEAFTALKFNNDAQFINPENIGNLNYISVYVPFVNNKNKLIGYIHLPFFDKENILKKEIFNLLATILNLYLILFVFIAVAAWWMTNKITFPLTVLRQRFADIDLSKTNAIIDWQANDEIGSVVKEYNNMVIQLDESAAKLAQNQRELAWREMAKQVAHEIKNPLTPMKLNVQLLQRNLSLDEKTFKEKFEKVAKSLVEQIDSLANIANDFSNFAQITKNKPETLNLIELTENVISIFKSEENVEITFDYQTKKVNIFADKDHILRILNNLIKNSIQAENDNSIVKIKIKIKVEINKTILTVSDNAKGIANDMKDKIFKPYFTTKTSGTGLGLAMVHQIVESMNGKIYFEDLLPSGTKFTVEFYN